ncbi:MAG: TetR/AcrR family transcriptional regulator [Bacteroidales bacterium]
MTANTEKEGIKEQIVAIAMNVFSKFGFKKTTLDDIATALGKGKSSIYYYFKSKEEIYKEVIKKEADLLRNEIFDKVINRDIDPKDKLRDYVLIRMRFLRELVNFNEALRNDYMTHFAFVDKIRERYDKEEHEVIEGILCEGRDKGVFVLDDTNFAAMAFVTAMKGFEIPLFIKHEITLEDLEERLDGMLEILFYGLVKRENSNVES